MAVANRRHNPATPWHRRYSPYLPFFGFHSWLSCLALAICPVCRCGFGCNNCDVVVRDWWRENRSRISGRRVAWLEWDALVTTALPDVWPAGMLGKDLKDEGWHWWGERAALPELADHWCGVAPLGVTFWNAAALDAIAAEEYDEIYARDVFCELRTPSVCRKAGFPVESISLPGVRWYPVKAGTVPGIYHAVKG